MCNLKNQGLDKEAKGKAFCKAEPRRRLILELMEASSRSNVSNTAKKREIEKFSSSLKGPTDERRPFTQNSEVGWAAAKLGLKCLVYL